MDQKENKVNIKNVNELVSLSKKLLNLLYIIIIILGIYAVIRIGKEIGLGSFLASIFKILMPLFIGLLISWLFNPLVRKMQRKGIRRSISTILIYVIFVGIIALISFTVIPSLFNQIQEFVKQIPTISESIQAWISEACNKVGNVGGVDVNSMKLSLFARIEEFGTNLSTSLPENLVKVVSAIFSGLGTFLVGLIIGFYALLGFEHPAAAVKDFLPKRMHRNFDGIIRSINEACRNFINGSIIDCFMIFVVSAIALWLVGLKAPILFGLFCGITNIIPYAGPYIGGIPAVIVGFTQSPLTGILSLVVLCIIQGVEGNILQPMIMSKTTKLHPITIIMGLLLFGHFWGIIGMIVSTPLIATLKAIIIYFDEKYDFLSFK